MNQYLCLKLNSHHTIHFMYERFDNVIKSHQYKWPIGINICFVLITQVYTYGTLRSIRNNSSNNTHTVDFFSKLLSKFVDLSPWQGKYIGPLVV